MPSQLYLVDLFGSQAAASALGANILLRSMFGAFLPLAGSHMYLTLNYGWGNTAVRIPDTGICACADSVLSGGRIAAESDDIHAVNVQDIYR
ncbi:major facilitator superfamily domain-containing protein [Penicillium canescens]|nr:major facilitator superfamily domain-containing protein [Penicillium canescens]